MRKFATIDCETDPFKQGRIPAPFIWGFYDGERFEYFYKTSDLIDRVKEFDGLVYAHNGGKFDFHFLFDGIEPQEGVMLINGRIAKFKMGKAELRDSFLLLPCALSAYKKDDIDYALFEKGVREKHLDKIHSYLYGDCKYLWEILNVQFQEYGQHLTLASSAFDYWHRKFNTNNYKPKSSADFFKKFRPFYHGGRVQCFEKGIINTDFELFDINSAYPFAMTHEHPYGKTYSIGKKVNEKNIEQSFIIFKGKSDGVLPFKDNGLKFPDDSDTRTYHATGWEFKLALEKNLVEIDTIECVYEFEETINFTGYVEKFFKLKNELKGIDDAKYLLSKLYLNSLYGKLGQSGLSHRDYEIVEPQYIESYNNDNFEFEGYLGQHAIMSRQIDDEKMRFFNVATAASITGFVRAYLYSHILDCERVLYCDTDSLACVGFKGDLGRKLGQWSKEGDFSQAAIGGKKLYAFKYLKPFTKNGEKITHKISSKGAKLKAKEIISVARGEKITYKSIAPTFRVGKKTDFLVREIRMT